MAERRNRPVLIPENIDDLQELCKAQRKTIESMKAEIEDQKMKIHESKYRSKKLTAELESLRESQGSKAEKMVRDMQRMAQKMSRLHHIQSNTVTQSQRALAVLSGLERHSQHGHHLNQSRTAVSLLLQIRESINAILDLNSSESLDYPPIVADDELLVPSIPEDESDSLKDRIRRLQDEVSVLRKQEHLILLIPQYRKAIVRLKSERKKLLSELDVERKRSSQYLAQLTSMLTEVRMHLSFVCANLFILEYCCRGIERKVTYDSRRPVLVWN